MRQRGLPDARHVFDQKVSTRQQADDGHFDDLRLTLDDEPDIIL